MTRRAFGALTATLLARPHLFADTPSGSFSASNWMAALPDTKLLSELNIPGTHDSGARFGGNMSITQEMTIQDQLTSGIRFLDIRCRRENDTLRIYHGIQDQHLDFKTGVAEVCANFLTANPTECILMLVKEEGSPKNTTKSFEYLFTSEISSGRSRWSTQATIGPLGQVRGKIVLLRRFSGTLGIDCTQWQDDATFAIPLPGGMNMRIQDGYAVPTLFDIGKKWDRVERLLDEAVLGTSRTMYINYTSGASTGAYPNAVAFGSPGIEGINRRMFRYLKTREPGRYGIIPMDFPGFPSPTGVLIRLIISLNGLRWNDVWTFPIVISDQNRAFTRAAPSLVVMNGKIYMAFLDNTPSKSDIWVCSSGDGRAWSGCTNVSLRNRALTRTAPALAAMNGKLYMVFLDNNPSSSDIWMCWSSDGVNWSDCRNVSKANKALTRATPGLAAMNGKLHLVFLDDNPSSSDIWACWSSDGLNWSECKNVTRQNRALTRTSPALAAMSNRLYMAFLDNTPSKSDLWSCSSDDGEHWSPCVHISEQNRALTKTAPSLCSNGRKLYLTFVDNNPSETMIYSCSSADGQGWSPVTNISAQNQALSRATPSVIPFGPDLRMAFLDDSLDQPLIWTCSMHPGT